MQRVRQGLDHREVLGAADPAAARDDDRSLGQFRTVACHSGLALDDLGRILGHGGHLDVDHLAGTGGGFCLDGAGADGDHRGVTGGLRVDGERTTEDGVHADGTLLDLDDVDEQSGAKAGGQPARDLLAVGICGQHDGRRGGGLDQRREHVDDRGDQVARGVIRLGDVDLHRAGLLEPVDQRRGGTRLRRPRRRTARQAHVRR